MVKFILIKSPDEWATTKQACRDELVVYVFFSSVYIYILTEIKRSIILFYNILTWNNIKYSYLREIREIHIFRGQVKVCDRQQSVVTASLIIKYSYLREIRKIRIFRNHQKCLPVE